MVTMWPPHKIYQFTNYFYIPLLYENSPQTFQYNIDINSFKTHTSISPRPLYRVQEIKQLNQFLKVIIYFHSPIFGGFTEDLSAEAESEPIITL